jgi:hypothetical protein
VKNKAVIAILVMLTACAAQEEATTQDTEQAVRDFIAVRQLQEAKEMRTSNNDSWEEIDENFVIYTTRREVFLLEFTRRCYELNQHPVVADERKSGNVVHARFDTLRGCQIAKLFPLTEGEVAELSAIGESPGSRN